MSGSLNYTPTEKDLKAAYTLHLSKSAQKRLFIMVVVGLAVGIAVIFLAGISEANEAMLVVIGMLYWALAVTAAIFLIVRFYWLPRFVSRIFGQQKDLHVATQISWDETGFVADNANGRVQMPWRDFHRWKRTETMLLLYRSEAMFHFLPLNTSAAKQAANEMVRHLQAHGVKGDMQ